MATYKLSKNLDGSNVKIYKDGVELSLRTNIYDAGVTEHGWGGWKGKPDQLAFALAYDVSQNTDIAVEHFGKVAEIFSAAAPMELEISTGTIQLALQS